MSVSIYTYMCVCVYIYLCVCICIYVCKIPTNQLHEFTCIIFLY